MDAIESQEHFSKKSDFNDGFAPTGRSAGGDAVSTQQQEAQNRCKVRFTARLQLVRKTEEQLIRTRVAETLPGHPFEKLRILH